MVWVNALISFKLLPGPESSKWYTINSNDFNRIDKLLRDKGSDYFKEESYINLLIRECLDYGIEVTCFEQKAGDLVFLPFNIF